MAATDKPVLLVEDIARKIQELDREVKYLVNKAKTFKPKVKKPAKEDKNKTETGKGWIYFNQFGFSVDRAMGECKWLEYLGGMNMWVANQRGSYHSIFMNYIQFHDI